MEEHDRVAARPVAAQPPGEQDEVRAEQRRGDRVQRPEPDPHGDGEGDEHDRVEQDLARRLILAAGPRQHRHVCGPVVLLDHQCERPEVRRRPEEDDQEQPERR